MPTCSTDLRRSLTHQRSCLINHERSSFTDDIDSEDDVNIYLFGEKPPRVKTLSPLVVAPFSATCSSNTSRVSPLRIKGTALQVDVNWRVQSWLDDDKIIVKAIFPESFGCVIAGSSECGKTFLLRNLFLSRIQFDRLYIIGPTGDQFEDLKNKDIVFIKEKNIYPLRSTT